MFVNLSIFELTFKLMNHLYNEIWVMSEQDYNPETYEELMQFADSHSLNEGDKFCAQQSPSHQRLGLLRLLFISLLIYLVI